MARFTVIFDRDAATDLAAIRDYISKARDPVFASVFADRIISYCEGFASLPHRGTKRDDILNGLRTVSWRRTVTVAFQVIDQTRAITILGVFYRGRDVLSALRERTKTPPLP